MQNNSIKVMFTVCLAITNAPCLAAVPYDMGLLDREQLLPLSSIGYQSMWRAENIAERSLHYAKLFFGLNTAVSTASCISLAIQAHQAKKALNISKAQDKARFAKMSVGVIMGSAAMTTMLWRLQCMIQNTKKPAEAKTILNQVLQGAS